MSTFKNLLIITTLLFGGLIHAQSNFTSKSIGVGVVVADMQRSLDFYVKGIGMVKTGNFTINAEFGKRGGLTGGEAVDVNGAQHCSLSHDTLATLSIN